MDRLRVCALVLAASALACHKDPWEKGGVAGTAPSTSAVDSSNHVSISTDDAAIPADLDAAAATLGIDPAFLTAAPVSGKSIGHTSIVFKVGLEGGRLAAYKPRSKVGGERFRGEIAAYRLARAWGLNNVPEADFRAFPAPALSTVLDDAAKQVFADQVIIEGDGTVRGALIPWISHLEFLPLEKPEQRAKWTPWLESADAGAPTKCDAWLAGQISTMIAFDVMTGNWDRWSSGNIGNGLGSGCTTVLYIDNDGAFFDPPPKQFMDRQLAELHKLRHFSKSFATALRSTNEDALRRALGEESRGRPLLPEKLVLAFMARRQIVLDAIAGATKAWGEESTLSLP